MGEYEQEVVDANAPVAVDVLHTAKVHSAEGRENGEKVLRAVTISVSVAETRCGLAGSKDGYRTHLHIDQ